MNQESSFYQEIADGYKKCGTDQLERVKAAHNAVIVNKICNELKVLLEDNRVDDQRDLAVFTKQYSVIQRISKLLFDTRPSNASIWATPLLFECYKNCAIPDIENRAIFTIKASLPEDYSVYIDLLRFVYKKSIDFPKIDIFTIPHSAEFDISSIALIGHEVGHILCQLLAHKFNELIDRLVAEEFGSGEHEKSQQFSLFDSTDERKRLSTEIAKHLEEHLCDLIGAKLFGFAFDLSFVRTFLARTDINKSSESHPVAAHRMHLAYQRMCRYCEAKNSSALRSKKVLEKLQNLCAAWISYTPSQKDSRRYRIAKRIFDEIVGKHVIPVDTQKAWEKVAPELDGFRPPFETVNDDMPHIISPIEIVVGASLYYYSECFTENDFYITSKHDEHDKKYILGEVIISHALYAISLYEFVKDANSKLSTSKIEKEFYKGTLWDLRTKHTRGEKDGLIITPTISPLDQYSVNSIDLRLGSSFLVNQPSKFTHISPEKICHDEQEKLRFEYSMFNKIDIPIGKQFILHPHQFVLASTLEYVCLPHDHYAMVLGRSTWGRLGLNIATATTVQAGFRGCLTLELRNLGETPLPLTIGTRIAQLSVLPVPAEITSSGEGYFASKSKYIGPVAVGLPKIATDPDWDVLKNVMSNREK